MDKLEKAAREGNFTEVAKIVGEPLDPKKPYPEVVKLIADVDTTGVGVDLYSFDVDEDVKEVYILANNAATITTVQVTPSNPNTVTFNDIASREYRFHLYDLYRAKYDIVGKKKKAITRSMDAKEIKLVLDVALAAVPGANAETGEADAKFKYPNLIDMIEDVMDYGDNFVLVAGASVWKDMILWDYDENKYRSLKDALEDLGIARVRVSGTVKTDGGGAEALLDADKIILVALNSVTGKPIKFSRRELPSGFEGIKEEKDATKQRIVIISPAIMNVGADRLPSVGAVGLESIAIVATNSKCLASFEKTYS